MVNSSRKFRLELHWSYTCALHKESWATKRRNFKFLANTDTTKYINHLHKVIPKVVKLCNNISGICRIPVVIAASCETTAPAPPLKAWDNLVSDIKGIPVPEVETFQHLTGLSTGSTWMKIISLYCFRYVYKCLRTCSLYNKIEIVICNSIPVIHIGAPYSHLLLDMRNSYWLCYLLVWFISNKPEHVKTQKSKLMIIIQIAQISCIIIIAYFSPFHIQSMVVSSC